MRSRVNFTQTPQDRLHLVTQVFKAKLEELKIRLLKDNILGEVQAYVYVVEFKKRGLPHAYWLLNAQEFQTHVPRAV
jgi:hypothetical protein